MFKEKNKLLRYILIPILLILTWFALTLLQIISNDESLTVIMNKYQPDQLQNPSLNRLMAGDSRTFEFEATEDNLGAVKINFETFDGNNTDIINFSIHEKGEKNPFYEIDQNSRAFTSLNFYPFGFPIQKESKGKEYVVQIASESGTKGSSVAIKNDKYIFAAIYQFEKGKIVSDPIYAAEYLLKKTVNSIENNYLFFSSSVYIYPFIFYLIWLLSSRYIKKKNLLHNPVSAILIITVLFDIFFIDQSFDLVFLLISILWGWLLMYLKKDCAYSYKAALALLILCPLLQLLEQDQMVEKAAAWAFLALTVGVIMNIYALKHN